MNESINVVEKIYQYFQINISENDILPKDVCRSCYQKVFDTCEFHQQIKNAQNILQAKLVIKCEEVDVKSEDITSYDSWFYDDDEPLSNHIVAKSELKGKDKENVICN
ncbi:uncharacterized protein LOC123293905 [Chrysoperla carnea]|uniref:uncharacterized protein LOC123293905 n=1 Tax=Chrysoperla carnea TaxID=189513 RepID=UPI001D095088|nr:uncharacterized protein LOC123293905 [Chrysoperla carnea]